jgi:hypothetical protein
MVARARFQQRKSLYYIPPPGHFRSSTQIQAGYAKAPRAKRRHRRSKKVPEPAQQAPWRDSINSIACKRARLNRSSRAFAALKSPPRLIGGTGRQQLALEGTFFLLWMINLCSCSIINVPQCGPQFENSLGGFQFRSKLTPTTPPNLSRSFSAKGVLFGITPLARSCTS